MRFFIAVFFCISCISAANAKSYISAELKDIGERLENYHGPYYEVIDSLSGTITHLGIPIFVMSGNQDADAILRFIERISLYSNVLPPTDAKLMLDDKKVKMQSKIIKPDKAVQEYSYNANEKWIKVTWDGQEISFPNDYSQIIGLNKLETDSLFYVQLVSYSAENDRNEPYAQSHPQNDGDILVKKGMHYLIDEINTDKYYIKSISNDSLIPVFCREYPSESVGNLLQAIVANDIIVDLKQHRYGYRSSNYQKKIGDITAYCKQNNCEPYVGIESMENGVIKAVVVYRNKYFSYNHLLYVSISDDVLNEGKGTIEGEIYTFIPTYNLKTLYGESK